MTGDAGIVLTYDVNLTQAGPWCVDLIGKHVRHCQLRRQMIKHNIV